MHTDSEGEEEGEGGIGFSPLPRRQRCSGGRAVVDVVVVVGEDENSRGERLEKRKTRNNPFLPTIRGKPSVVTTRGPLFLPTPSTSNRYDSSPKERIRCCLLGLAELSFREEFIVLIVNPRLTLFVQSISQNIRKNDEEWDPPSPTREEN